MSKKERTLFRQLSAIAAFWMWWWCFGVRFWKSTVAFFVYPGNVQDTKPYGGPKFVKFLKRVWGIFPINRRKVAGKRWALTFALTHTADEMEQDPELVRELIVTMEERAQSIGASTVALAGRLPGICHRHGIELPDKFCDGVIGTCYTCIATVEQYIRSKQDMSQSDLTIAVVGVGFTGRTLMRYMIKRNGFRQFIGLDTVDRTNDFLDDDPDRSLRTMMSTHNVLVEGQDEPDPKLLITTDPAQLRKADIVIVLTAQGDDMRGIATHLKQDAVVFDDTHPQPSADVIALIQERTDNLFKVAMTRGGLVSWPQLSRFGPQDLEGCMVEAAVVAANGELPITDMDEFHRQAERLNIKPRYPRHRMR